MHGHLIERMKAERTQPFVYDASLIFSMREIGPAELDAGTDKLYKATEPITIVSERAEGLFDVFVVHSGKTSLYEIVRLGLWYRCSCRDFEYSQTACKHVAFVFPQVCRMCLSTPVTTKGTVCGKCQSAARLEEMNNAPYLKPSSTRKPEKVGNIRI